MRKVHLSILIITTVTMVYGVPRYTINLDAPPQDRWAPLITAQLDLHGWDHSYKLVLDFIESILPYSKWVKYDMQFRAVAERVLGPEVTAEVTGIYTTAKKLGYPVTLSQLEMLQLFYEILMECTGVLARTNHSSILHGRNMDMGLPVSNIIAEVEWLKDGKKVLISTQYLGYVGIHTGMRRGGWSVQANERVVLTPGPYIGDQQTNIIMTALAFLAGHQPVGSYIRNALLTARTFEEALPLLEHTPLASPMYAIVGGMNTGTVITRDRKGVATETQDTSVFGKHAVPPHAGVTNLTDGYLVQTNWDPWIAQTHASCAKHMAAFAPWEEKLCERYISALYADKGNCSDLCQLYSDGRKEVGDSLMSALPRNRVNEKALFRVMSTAPVHNGGTKFTSIMSAKDDIYSTHVWGVDPDPPGDEVAVDPSSMQRHPRPAIAEALQSFLRSLTGIVEL